MKTKIFITLTVILLISIGLVAIESTLLAEKQPQEKPFQQESVGIGGSTGVTNLSSLDVKGDIHASGSLESGNTIIINGAENTIYYENDPNPPVTPYAHWNLWFRGGNCRHPGNSYILFQNGLFRNDLGVAITMHESRNHNDLQLSTYDNYWGNYLFTMDPAAHTGQGFYICGGPHVQSFPIFSVNANRTYFGYSIDGGGHTHYSPPGNPGDVYVRGHVGIGTTNPVQRLDVAGVMRLAPTDSPGPCNPSVRGSIYYDNSLNEPCFCNGVNWRQFDGGGTC